MADEPKNTSLNMDDAEISTSLVPRPELASDWVLPPEDQLPAPNPAHINFTPGQEDQFEFDGLLGAPVGNIRQLGDPHEFGSMASGATWTRLWHDIDNTEVRRQEIEKLGEEKFLERYGAKKLHEDECGELWCIVFPITKSEDGLDIREEDITFIRVKNSSPNPDGSYRFYYLRVPPNTLSAREGIAWTFHKEPHEYNPIIQT